MNPWITIWTEPRATVRSILATNPRRGFWLLATLYALALSFSTANFYSWGLAHSFSAIFFPLVLLSPITGAVWLGFQAWILRLTGRLFGGHAPIQSVRAALAWSRTPYLLELVMWVVLMILHAETVFIQHAIGAAAAFIVLISLIINLWALVLLIQLIREVQGFSLGRAIGNVLVAWAASFIIVTIIAMIGRYIYISLLN